MTSDPDLAITVYSREECHLCERAMKTLETVAADEGIDLDLDEVDIDASRRLREEYGDRIPYVLVEGRPAFKYRLDPADVRERLREAIESGP